MTTPPRNKKLQRNPEQATHTPPHQAITQVQATFSGPIPHPLILEEYDRLVPGAAERILAMAEQDAKHQQAMETGTLKAAESSARRGQYFGLIIGLAALSAAMGALAMGSATVAGVIGGTTVVGLVSVFIIGRVVK